MTPVSTAAVLPPAGTSPPRAAPGTVRAPAVSVADRRHEHEHLLLWQVHGAAELVLDGERTTLSAGWACWIPAGVVHALTVRENSVVLPLLFDAAGGRFPADTWKLLRIPEELRPLLLLSVQYQNSIIYSPQGHGELEEQILALVAARSTLPLPRSEPARGVALAVRRDPADPRTVQELAAAVHVSYRTLERAFLQETGLTLHQWRITSRMQSATRLLREGIGIRAVAARVGYANVSAFGRVFKEHVGDTPRRYAQRQRGGC
ncbi:helix-turn-helix domain-containing protein [Brachybacterium sp. AOP43-C2-M15]|uniref:helix-turn-helix domain-containing protein n=1 Tax=Brachybacterium sp. AOP43-C2-M15 TaxID=3457661 RepID=UPI004033B12A